jgi:flagellar biosynthetic protein FlhB
MADSEASREDRNLPASERRLRQAAEEGRTPRSRDFVNAALMAAGLACCAWMGPAFFRDTLSVLKEGLVIDRFLAMHPDRLGAHVTHVLSLAAWACLPMMAVLAVVGAISSVVPGGWVLSLKPVTPDPNKVNPLSGIARIYSREALQDFLKLAVISLVLLGCGGWYLYGAAPRFSGLAFMPIEAALSNTPQILISGAWVLAGALILAALLDAPLQWIRFMDSMKMTHQEAKEEFKEAEGNQEVKGKIRQRQRQMSRGRMLAAVPTADVIVTNPTHYAVALRYDEKTMSVPRVVAKGADLLAARIKEIAGEAGVPIVESPALARALHAHVEIDEEVPAALYNAVAQVLAWVFQIRAQIASRDARDAGSLAEIEVPAELDPLQKTRPAQGDAGRTGGAE